VRVFTIGFTKKSARRFFEILKESGSSRIIDVRLNNASQLAGFAKRDDLAYFLEKICGMGYLHLPQLAPTKDLLDGYKKGRVSWEEYELRFYDTMRERRIEEDLDRDTVANSCLLCSEEKPHHCHRRLVAEYLQRHWSDLEIHHLG
jgi:uncharacterized protein (DUF488 family)